MTASGSIREVAVLVEDDHPTRERLARNVAACRRVQVVAAEGTYADGQAAILRHRPTVLVTDLGLPDGSGVDLIRLARAELPGCQIMVVTIFGDERNVLAAIEAGADSYLLKDASTDEIEVAIEQLVAGGSPMSPPIARHLLTRFRTEPGLEEANGDREAAGRKAAALSEREFEVLNLVAKGFTFREVAEMLEISPHTVRTHVRRIYGKLEVGSKSEAVYEAVSQGLIELS